MTAIRRTDAVTGWSDDVARFTRIALGSGRLGGDAKNLAGRTARMLEAGEAMLLPLNAADLLDRFQLRRNGDGDLGVECTACSSLLCEVEDRDLLGTLVRVAIGHLAGCPATP